MSTLSHLQFHRVMRETSQERGTPLATRALREGRNKATIFHVTKKPKMCIRYTAPIACPQPVASPVVLAPPRLVDNTPLLALRLVVASHINDAMVAGGDVHTLCLGSFVTPDGFMPAAQPSTAPRSATHRSTGERSHNAPSSLGIAALNSKIAPSSRRIAAYNSCPVPGGRQLAWKTKCSDALW